ncbi:hypothetical protein HII31_13300 [Pseudocercospora fuligena]|uniref:Fucose-specific lectin n=1 Tax=Pseudocercospora fuligena TaxID=685502 RepID=A0A8H6R662_9PEZI|nr:hypothetical protein HII31_13300 [Pseudocercospora fuligena]
MRRKVALWVIALVVAIIIIAAALGGALGATLGNKSSNNSSSSSGNGNNGGSSNDPSAGTLANNIGNTAQDKTGLALLHMPNSDDLYMYYMSEGNQIVEAKYSNSNWQKQNRDLPASTTNITNDAADGSPIAAIHYTLQGNTIYRQIFFIGSNGLIATCNTTDNAAWSSPYNPVIDLKPSSTTKSLAAVADTSSGNLYGIRVYFGSSAGYIQEIGTDFGEAEPPYWHSDWSWFNQSDPEAGVASVLINNNNHLYLRNSTTGLLQQWTWNYVTKDGWQVGANASNSHSVAENGAVAALTDGQSTDMIFYQQSGGKTVMTTFSGNSFGNFVGDEKNLNSASIGYGIAAAWAGNDGGAVLNQNSSDSNELLLSSVATNGQTRNWNTNTGTD